MKTSSVSDKTHDELMLAELTFIYFNDNSLTIDARKEIREQIKELKTKIDLELKSSKTEHFKSLTKEQLYKEYQDASREDRLMIREILKNQ